MVIGKARIYSFDINGVNKLRSELEIVTLMMSVYEQKQKTKCISWFNKKHDT